MTDVVHFSHIKKAFGVANIACPHPHILFLDRDHRRAKNLQQLVNATRKLGFSSVEVVNFDGWSLEQQMEKVKLIQSLIVSLV